MKVSVIMPTYNRAYIIRDAIESALGQTYRDFELIVVDDGSSDNTREIVDQVAEGRIRYVWHDRNRGYSAACNTGIAAATGQAIGFLDSDDLWQPGYLARQVAFLLRHPELDAVFTDTEIRGGTVIPSLIGLMKIFPKLLNASCPGDEFSVNRRQMYLCLLEEVPIKPTALIAKREVFERVGGFDEEWPSGTDWDLFLRLSHFARFGYTHLPLVVQRRTDDATHQKFREQDKLFLLQVFMKEKRALQNDPEAKRAINRGISDHCNNLGYYYLHTGRRWRALTFYLRGFEEAKDAKMLARALAALVPLKARQFVKSMLRKAHPLGA